MTIQDAIQEYDNFRQRTRQTDSVCAIDNQLLHHIGEVADVMGLECYVVGGYVRDIILERPSKDIDVVVVNPKQEKNEDGPGIRLAKALSKDLGRGAHVSVFRNFGTAQLKWRDQEVEFVGARRESYQRDSRKPIVEDGTLDDDLHRRDFTINALAVCLNQNRYGELIDLFDGLLDLEDGIIATPLDPDITFSDDPLRMMRCIRFATQLRFEIEEETQEALKRNAERIKIISQERIIDELNKIMMTSAPSIGFIELSRSGLLPIILPEVAALEGVESRNGRAHKDNFYHTLEVLDNVASTTDGESSLYLRWAALLHDIGKPRSKRWDNVAGWTFHNHNYIGQKMVAPLFRRLKLPLDERLTYVEKLVGLHMRPIAIADDEVTDSAVRRLLFEAGEDIDDLMLLCEADITSKNREKKQRFLQNFQLVREKLIDLQARDNYRTWHNPITGEEIMETFGLQPCREVGILKQAIKDAIWDSLIPNEHDAAFQFMLSKAKEMNLLPKTTSQQVNENITREVDQRHT
ncbi:MAG: HD domain-containing protein [Bacteroidaceae bacterium]|nr:HD domain-containing protein [Bacteroidaceae bacterium]